MTIKEGISIFKWGAALIIAVLLFMFWRGCKSGGSVKPTNDTVAVKIDTIWMLSETDTYYTPAVVKTEYRSQLVYKTDTLETFEYIKADTATILKNYLATRYYQDSIVVQYGKVYIDDTVTRNKIVSRGVRTEFNIPVIKESVILYQPSRTIAYLGFEGIGSHESIVYGVGASFGFKFKNDKYYGVKALISKDGNPLYGVELKIPIRFRKK
jgi:hypothetical protein